MANNLYKRPMFRKGGSAEGGITSGLKRQGYAMVLELLNKMIQADKELWMLWVWHHQKEILMIF